MHTVVFGLSISQRPSTSTCSPIGQCACSGMKFSLPRTDSVVVVVVVAAVVATAAAAESQCPMATSDESPLQYVDLGSH